jgi:hypothetical protein
MTAGLPGAGIGGIFYLVSALAMPFRELYRALRGDWSLARWRLVARQTAMAAGIFGGLWLTGWAIGELVGAAVAAGHLARAPEVLRGGALLLSFGTLTLVLVAVQVARVVLHARRRPVGGPGGTLASR